MALTFGTAGIRGPLGPGPDEMNSGNVRRVVAGVGAYLTDRLKGAPATTVIGYDARHQSEDFAREAAGVLIAAGHATFLLPKALPTPVLAFAVRSLNADTGIMITASHNPASDNGLKVYLGGRLTDDAGRGALIVSPTDVEIQRRIDDVGARVERETSGWSILEDMEEKYVAAVAGLVPEPGTRAARRAALPIVLTPLHGVGGATTLAVLTAAGFSNVRMVLAQADPDPDFPTVPFPNPEEPGVMNLAFDLAKSTGAALVIALDPDADRCGVGIPIDGKWVRLHGDRVGCLLAELTAGRMTSGQEIPGVEPGSRVFARSIVSSRLLDSIAARHGLEAKTTLTGFKWLSRVPSLAFAYEEALGYCVAPELVRDKDGISTALVIAEYASLLASHQSSLATVLDDLDRTYGVHLTHQTSLRLPPGADLTRIISGVLALAPKSFGDSPVVSIEDGLDGLDGLPPAPSVRLRTASGASVTVRPSGTEPKVKAYLEVIRPPSEDLARERSAADDAMAALEAGANTLIGGRRLRRFALGPPFLEDGPHTGGPQAGGPGIEKGAGLGGASDPAGGLDPEAAPDDLR